MAYGQFLVAVGDYYIPMQYIQADSYKITRNTQDLDSYNDANGLLHRNALSLVCDKMEFNTPYMWDIDVEALFEGMEAQYTSRIERKANVTVYVPEFNCYQTQPMYLSNPEISIYKINFTRVLYEPIRICFIGYGVEES